MTLSEEYYRIEKVDDNIQLCFIDIILFVGKYIKWINYDNFRREKAIYFDPEGLLGCYFDETEFQKINQYKILKKQIEWMAGKIAVKKLVAAFAGINENQIQILAKESGAPFLPEFPEISISITHSERYAVSGIGLNNYTVAVDIEKIEENRMESVGRVAFSERELSELRGKGDTLHYTFWTVKEAFLKFIGKGFAEGLKKVEFLDGGIVHHGKKIDGLHIDSKIIDSEYAFTLIY